MDFHSIDLYGGVSGTKNSIPGLRNIFAGK